MSTNTHPLEEVFDLEEGSTDLTLPDERSTELVAEETYDPKDKEIEEQFQEVYDSAMTAFEGQSDDAQLIDPKYRARTHEIAAQYLGTALNAAKEKSILKQHKDKLNIDIKKAQGAKVVNQNLIVDRNEILKALMGEDEEKIVE